MKLGKRNKVLVSFMLFSLFFGAGNLIFPPFLGQNAGSATLPAMLGFLLTAVVLPVLGVIVVARFDGLDRLAQQVGPRFALVFTLLIYLSIGPGLGIPRAASVPFEMAVAPYLPEDANATLWMVVYSLLFFLVALWLCLTPGKLVSRIGHVLTPSLLALLVFLFISFLTRGQVEVAAPQSAYQTAPFLKGFAEGYQTMDTIAALNFGLVISTTLGGFGLREKRDRLRYTRPGWAAGRRDPGAGVYDADLYGYVQQRRLSHPGERRMDAAVHRASAVWRAGRGTAGRHLYPGLPDHVRGAHQFHLAVFLHSVQKGFLSCLGVCNYGRILPDLQPGAQCHPEHLRAHPQRHLSCCHRADSDGSEPWVLAAQCLCVSADRRLHGLRQRTLRSGRRRAFAQLCQCGAQTAAVVRAGLWLGQRSGAGAGGQLCTLCAQARQKDGLTACTCPVYGSTLLVFRCAAWYNMYGS